MTNFEKLRAALEPSEQLELDKCKDIWEEECFCSAEYPIRFLLDEGMCWIRTPQGSDYWGKVFDRLNKEGK